MVCCGTYYGNIVADLSRGQIPLTLLCVGVRETAFQDINKVWQKLLSIDAIGGILKCVSPLLSKKGSFKNVKPA